MAFFNDLSKNLTKLGQDVTQKTQSFTDGVKINSQISDQKKNLAKLYEDLGRIAFQDENFCGMGEAQRFAEMIRIGEERLKELERQQSANKGEVQCMSCNAFVPAGNAFCPNCGAKVEPPVQNNPVKCPNCGTDLEPGASFCTNCGMNLNR